MTDDKLELGRRRAEELGLLLNNQNTFNEFYSAFHVHRLLGEGTECTWRIDNQCIPAQQIKPLGFDAKAYHKALLIGIREIRQESEERKLLREYFELGPFNKELYAKAKALLEKGE